MVFAQRKRYRCCVLKPRAYRPSDIYSRVQLLYLRKQCCVALICARFSYLYVSGMVAIGCGIDEYMALNPAFKGNRGVAGVAAGGAAPLLPPPLPPATT